MKLSLNKRQMTLGIMLSLTLVAVVVAYFHGESSPEVVQPVAKGREASVLTVPVAIPAGMADSLNITGLRQNMLGVDQHAGQVFASKSWYVPPPPPPRAPPPPPTAPPLPFAYMGRFQEGGDSPVIFLTRGELLYSVHVGEVIDETYRIEQLTPNEVIFIYLPMDKRQVLRIAEAS